LAGDRRLSVVAGVRRCGGAGPVHLMRLRAICV
jgi:hypothetical protein